METAVAIKIVVAPKISSAVMETARAMLPPGFELCEVDQGTPEFHAALQDAQFFLGSPLAGIDNEFFRSAPNLRLVQLVSAGYDRVDIEAARKASVPVATNGGANAIAASEHTIMLMLAVLKKLVWHHNNIVAGRWRVGDSSLSEASGKTLGIVGLGDIGKKVARRAAAFDMKIQYYNSRRLTEDQEDALGVRFVLFDELLRTSDVVTLHVPLTEATRNLMSTPQFALMPPHAILINTCRGPVVDESALYDALTSGRITAAGLDVMTQEPAPPKHPLFTLDNVTVTPHMAGKTLDNWVQCFRNSFDNIQRVAAGGQPRWVVPELRG
jgi:glyoxylate reductase/D-3-phosphoglycerate dehydrogenase